MPGPIGILGLGRMGRPIAEALRDAGYTVLAHDPAGVTVVGVESFADPVSLAARVATLISVLPGAREAESLDQVLPALAPGALWIDLTSNDPGRADRLALAVPAVASVAAPMAGGPAAARSRTIDFVVSGAPAAVERAAPVLAELGTMRVVGSTPGAAHLIHLLSNQLWFGQAVAVAEALLLAGAAGLDPAVTRSALAAGPAGSVFIDRYLPLVVAGDYLETFGLDRVVEELDLVVELARERGVPAALAEQVAALHREALERFGPVDGELLAVRLLEERTGRTLSGGRPELG